MNNPLVSVIMPVYNAEKYLHEAIQSVLDQSFPDLELIAINDGSTDNSKKIIQSFQDPRIRYFENPENWGIVRTRNRCLEEAKGKYLAVMDSDDVALPDKIKTQVEFLENNPDYQLCGSYFETINGNGKSIKTVRFPATDRDARSMLLFHNCFCHSTVVMRSELAKELQYRPGYDLIEDYELWYRISKSGKIINLPEVTTYYRVHGNNISTYKRRQMIEKTDKINHEILDDLKISYTTEEFALHASVQNYQFEYFSDKNKIRELENWLIYLLDELKKNNVYNEKVIFQVLAKKWIVACIRTKNYNKVFLNRIIMRYPRTYLKTLYKKLKFKR